MKPVELGEPWVAIPIRFLCNLLGCHHKHPPHARLTLRLGPFAVTFNVQGTFMTTLPDDKLATATIAYVDSHGHPAKVEGAPVWTSSDDTIFKVDAVADGMTATITPTGALGTAQVRITADADLGAGTTEIITLGDVEVVGGAAVSGNLTITVP